MGWLDPTRHFNKFDRSFLILGFGLTLSTLGSLLLLVFSSSQQFFYCKMSASISCLVAEKGEGERKGKRKIESCEVVQTCKASVRGSSVLGKLCSLKKISMEFQPCKYHCIFKLKFAKGTSFNFNNLSRVHDSEQFHSSA